MLKELKEDLEEVKETMCEQNGNINKETENLQRNQKETVELKSTVTEMVNVGKALEGSASQAGRESMKLKTTLDVIKAEKQRRKD